jgi:hypothetical protein
MTSATAVSGSQILDRSRRRIAVWALALTLGGAAVGTATTLAVTHDDTSASKAVPTAVVPGAVVVSDSHNLPATADAAEQWAGGASSSPGSRADTQDSFNYKLGPGPH